jgi:1-acyl-sn-glycerol-3-phosphate acyltransferase
VRGSTMVDSTRTPGAQRGRRKRRVLRGWPAIRTGFAFAVAGTLSLVLALVVMPPFRVLGDGREEREIRAQKAIHWFVRVYLRGLRILGVVRIQCVDGERLRAPGILVVANHPTLIDALALMSFMPQADCVVKDSYYENPFLAGAARGAGYIPSRDGPRLVSDCVERLARGRSVIIFPEGTRSPVNGLGPFARGAAHIALRAGCDPVPVTIRCQPAILYRGQAWRDMPDRSAVLTLSVGEPLRVKEVVSDQTSGGRAARALTASLRDYFGRQSTVVKA